MLLLALMLQTIDADEVVTPERLNARPPCSRKRDEITVCGDQLLAAERYRRKLEARPDPMTADKRPRIRIANGWCVRVGFTVNPERC